MGYGQTGKTRGTSPSSVLWVDPAGLSRFAFYAARLAPQENIVIRRSPLVIFKLARGFRVVTAGRRGCRVVTAGRRGCVFVTAGRRGFRVVTAGRRGCFFVTAGRRGCVLFFNA